MGRSVYSAKLLKALASEGQVQERTSPGRKHDVVACSRRHISATTSTTPRRRNAMRGLPPRCPVFDASFDPDSPLDEREAVYEAFINVDTPTSATRGENLSQYQTDGNALASLLARYSSTAPHSTASRSTALVHTDASRLTYHSDYTLPPSAASDDDAATDWTDSPLVEGWQVVGRSHHDETQSYHRLVTTQSEPEYIFSRDAATQIPASEAHFISFELAAGPEAINVPADGAQMSQTPVTASSGATLATDNLLLALPGETQERHA
ncbi:uncharacterized protein L969DRAFT_53599 [Mixia osmundae IAM 14324]|uniref:Uncharacterized protein n=1 Tax=Mixia osmundae (strain CBS 9802 / IAM 14324 / JCM 22182 / KY 12970) TaxID=764103 RepID=G7DZH5_MIXOS|nr:uncharacterized protein L969DRAFT_53599 [Mixia osmundae IAM 14324]KEI37155.1 hypothetical protein L969DRAFT_53599 [Mixia osmundae IAM 14324]GAA95985.1 hypothetical protein E5Q_02643 [Mixia osmundae IAM 14324]